MLKLLSLIFLVPLVMAEDVGKKSKAPRIFWTTTTQSYTSMTLSTTTWCFRTSTAAATACTGRRRRTVILDQASEVEPLQISPTVKDDLDGELDVDDSIDEEEDRDKRYLQFYFYTTTLTSTTTVATSYTSTSTVASLHCTPSGFLVSVC